MKKEGFANLAEKLVGMLEDDRVAFLGEKKERDRTASLPDGEEISSWSRRNKEWLFNTVSGEGKWRQGGQGGRGGVGGRGSYGGGREQAGRGFAGGATGAGWREQEEGEDSRYGGYGGRGGRLALTGRTGLYD